ncbi:MAG TPA: AMP-binding protein [Caulobacteraceae bacterium]|nr:AMP-binding protein [Caulobacteraceae bacterium]
MDAYQQQPWLSLYPPGMPPALTMDYPDALAMFRAAVARAPDGAAVHYFDATLTWREVDADSNALAAALCARGVAAGDRVALYLQNVPAFLIGMLAAWKAGAIAVPVNPMNREREVGLLLADATPKALICHDTLHRDVVLNLPDAQTHLVPRIVLTTSPLDRQSRDDPRLFREMQRVATPDAEDLDTTIARHRGQRPPLRPLASDDIAFLVYTSGTTGLPKGATNTHANVSYNAQFYRDWIALEDGVGVLGIAPLFHITGLVGHLLTAIITASPVTLTYRFDPAVMLEAAAERRPGFTVAAITALMAMMNHSDADAPQLASLTKIYSGGAPIPPTVVEAFQAKFGHYVHNIYGLTETSSPTHATPLGERAPVDPNSGALSVGVPIPGARIWIAAEDGQPAPLGEAGEIVSAGPMVVPGYWNKPAETAEAMRPDGFRTGDVAFMDAAGWFFLIDRKKDMINAAGYKVWPREVEDVLYTHPAVREAAVVGVKDAYRGETVKAVVSLKAGAAATPDELIQHCKARMAAYKYPRMLEIIDELPKTVTGKILRRELRG